MPRRGNTFAFYESGKVRIHLRNAPSGKSTGPLEVIACAERVLAVAELGIPTRYGDEISYLNPLVYGMRVLRVLARTLVGAYGPPRRAG